MSSFDPEAFMNAEVSDANETDYSPIPKGDWSAYINDIKPREISRSDGSKARVADVLYVITDQQVAEAMEQDEPQVRQTLWLDFDDNGALAFGKNKNVQLGKLREAAGQNDPSQPWSFRKLIGAGPFKVSVDHDAEGKYANVTAVVKAA